MTQSDDPGVIERRAAGLAKLLSATDAPQRAVAFPERRIAAAELAHSVRSTWRWRAAAALLVVLTGAAMVPPVRAWIAGAARGMWQRVAGNEEPVVAAPLLPPPAPSHRVSFTPPPGQFVLEVSSRQAGGAISIRSVSGDSAVAELAGNVDDAELVVMPGGLRIVNAAGAASTYNVSLPSSLARVVVRVGSERARYFTPSPAGQLFVVELGRTAPSRSLQD